MIPIRDITRLEICDLLVHPTRGFAIIDSIDDDAAGTTIVGVEWSGRRGVGTAAFPLQQVCETFLLAVPWGFVFRAFREPQQLRVLL